jgi:hypothetical protein
MRIRTTFFVALTAATALVVSGTGARAIPSAPGAGPRPGGKPGTAPAKTDVRSDRVTIRPVGRGFPDPKFPAAKKGPSSNDAFARLGGPVFAAYGTGTVLHSDPELSGSDIAVTIDMAAADAVYSVKELSAFADELGRPIVKRLPAGSGQAHARAIQIDPPDAAGDDVDLGEPADSKAPPIERPVKRETKADLAVVKADLFRAEAAARAVSTGCVIGNDLARAAASADDTDVGGSGRTKPLLSLSAEEPDRAVSNGRIWCP